MRLIFRQPLIIVAENDPSHHPHYETHIKPLFDHALIEYVGTVDEQTKREFMRGAYAIIAPFGGAAPYDLTLIEAMAFGTPVLALDHGSIPEVIRSGVSGIIAREIDDLVAAVPRIVVLDRRACRDAVEAYFSTQQMATCYEQIYERVIVEQQSSALYGESRTVGW